MTDWHPTIVKIEKLEKHPDADNLSIATVLENYPVIVKNDEFSVGELVCYFPIDTILPDIEIFHFLSPRNFIKYEENGEIKQKPDTYKFVVGEVPENKRVVKAKRLRGVYSQGLLWKNIHNLSESDSIVDVFSLKKYEDEGEENVIFKKRKVGANAETPPTDFKVPYYDIEGLRKYLSCLKDDEDIVITEKIHGSNAAFVFDGNKFWAKSRNFFKKKNEDCMWWDIAIRFSLEEKLAKYPKLVFFGEVYGQVKGFRYDTDGESKVIFFDIYNTVTKQFLDYKEFCQIIDSLELNRVPEFFVGKVSQLSKEELFAFAEGQSTLSNKHVREGFVLKTLKERFEPRLNDRMSIKLVGEGYNLKKH